MSLPEHPCLDQYRRQAKELLRAVQSGEPDALNLIREHQANALAKPKPRLTDAQHSIARRERFASWTKLKSAVILAETKDFLDEVRLGDADAVQRRIARLPILAKATTDAGETPLHLAAERNDVRMAEVLVKGGVDPKQFYGFSSHTAMSWAITVGSLDFARELIRLGGEPDLFVAAGLGDIDRVRAFWDGDHLRSYASITGSSRFAADGSRLPRPPETDKEVISDAFVMACRNGQIDVARWLLDKGADLGFRGYIGGAALHWAEYSGNRELCAMLREVGASDDVEDAEFRAKPPAFGLLVSAAWGLERRLEALLDTHAADVNVRGGWGTPLNAAAWNGETGTAKLLLSRGADPTLRNEAGLTPLEVAQYKGFTELVALFESTDHRL